MQAPAFSSNERVIATQRHVSQTVAGEVVILHLDDGAYYGLNEVGTRVWQLLQEPRTPEEIAKDIVREFEVEPEQCARDIDELLRTLFEKGLVQADPERE
jgi:hypothetical protein